jgi:hypothetical protein
MDQTSQRLLMGSSVAADPSTLLGYAIINNPAANVAATTKSYSYTTEYIAIVDLYRTSGSPTFGGMIIYDTATFSRSVIGGAPYYLNVFSFNTSRTFTLAFNDGTNRSVTVSATSCGSSTSQASGTVPASATSVSVTGWTSPGYCPAAASTTSTFSGGVIFNYSASPTLTGTEISSTYKWSDVLSDSQSTLTTFNSSAYSSPSYYTFYVYPNYLGGKVYRQTSSMAPPGNHATNVTITWPAQYYL